MQDRPLLPEDLSLASPPMKCGVIDHDEQGASQGYKQQAMRTQMAAEQGDTLAQTKLGAMYLNGQGLPQNCVLAHMWWSLGAVGGNAIARKRRDAAATLMTPTQIAQAQQLAREWKPTLPEERYN